MLTTEYLLQIVPVVLFLVLSKWCLGTDGAPTGGCNEGCGPSRYCEPALMICRECSQLCDISRTNRDCLTYCPSYEEPQIIAENTTISVVTTPPGPVPAEEKNIIYVLVILVAGVCTSVALVVLCRTNKRLRQPWKLCWKSAGDNVDEPIPLSPILHPETDHVAEEARRTTYGTETEAEALISSVTPSEVIATATPSEAYSDTSGTDQQTASVSPLEGEITHSFPPVEEKLSIEEETVC